MLKSYWLLLVLLALSVPAYAQRPEKGVKVDGYSIFNPTPPDSMRKLNPDRPGITESPFTVEPGHVQIEGDFLRLLTGRSQGVRSRTWQVAPLIIKLGITDQFDFQVGIEPYVMEKGTSPDAPTERRSSFGDLTLRVKRNLFGDDDETRAAMGITGFVRLPTGGNIGSGGTEIGLIIPFNYHLTDDWDISAQLEGDRNYDPETSRHYFQLVPAITAEHSFTNTIGAYGEVLGRWNARENSWQAIVNFGPKFQLSKNAQLDMGTILPFTRDTEREFFVGITIKR